MVQVDVFWSYGLSSGLALAGRRRIIQSRRWWDNEVFLASVIWSACVFAPSGLYLLWTNPSWETMFVARDFSNIPAWLVAVFGITNVTQGILGFYVTSRFLRAGRRTAAIAQPIWSHLAMLGILIYGWDGSGYQRFFYPGTGDDWYGLKNFPFEKFFSSPIFYALLTLAVFFVPTYFGLVAYFRKHPVIVRA